MTTSIGSAGSTGTVSSLGIGSGLDVNSIISSLMGVESQPLTLLQNQASTISTEISAVGQIKSLTSSFGDAAQALADTSLWSKTTSSSSDSTVVTADTSSGTAVAGDYSVTVSQLAQGQTVTSKPFSSSSATLSTGTITIQLGTWSGTPPSSFAANTDATPVPPITIGPNDTSLSAIRDKINAANAGVTASIITDANGARLSLRSTATGAENGFKITATEDVDDGDPTTGLSALNYDPSSANSQLTLNQSAVNAKATVNGIDVESASNTLSNISDGLSLTLAKVSSTPVDVSVSTDTASMTTAVNSFVSAFNSLNSYIAQQTKYDATSQTGGPLQGDPSIIGFQNQMRNVLNTDSSASSMYARLSDIGITIQADGSLAADSTKLSAALSTNPQQVKALFATDGTTNADTGFAVRFSNLADQSLDTTNGNLATRYTGLQGELSRNSTAQSDMQTHLDATQARLTAQYQALDTQMSQMSALSSYVTQQMALMAKA
jgi:flagellar hook-associated protein 2